jgi:hypothetical protein
MTYFLRSKIIIYMFVGLVFGTIPWAVSAASLKDATDKLGVVTKAAGTTEGSLENVVGDIISTALTLVGLIFLILMVYAGYLWMTARGAEDQIEKSKSIISAAVIGLVLVMSAYAISVLVTGSLGTDPNVTDPDAACRANGPTYSCGSATCTGTTGADPSLCPAGQHCCPSP